MGRENEKQAFVGSSIVLLQERFKQLERLKVMREEKQLLQLLPQSTYIVHDEPRSRDPLALGLNLDVNCISSWNDQNQEISPCNQRMLIQQNQFPSAIVMRPNYNFIEKADVDTSLRL